MLSKDQVKQVLEVCGGDGHSILSAEAFTFLPEEFLKPLVVTHKSDGTPKGTITNEKGIVKAVKGVYSLDILRKVADDQEVKYLPAFGRGTEARRISEALGAKVEA